MSNFQRLLAKFSCASFGVWHKCDCCRNSTHILFDQGFLHITVITTISYIICAMSSLIIHPPATPLSAGSPTKNSFPRAPASQQPQPSSVQHKAICTWSAPQDTRNGALRRGIKAHPKDFFFRIWTINLHFPDLQADLSLKSARSRAPKLILSYKLRCALWRRTRLIASTEDRLSV